MKSKRIINDPVYGFITIDDPVIQKIIDHPIFQRMRRIRQLGLTDLVYPGAVHHRFHHALGAMHLMTLALNTLRNKGVRISDEEFSAAKIAILLHDIGHGPFSHTLEFDILRNVPHEKVTLFLMGVINDDLNGKLDLAIAMFSGTYKRKFFNQLVAGQLDMDRLDYLKRDSFYTGVMEGTVGISRIIHMLNVVNDMVVVEKKGIYSVENFLTSRRLMYWQVYLHKTAVSADQMLTAIMKRVRTLIEQGTVVEGPEGLILLLSKKITLNHFKKPQYYNAFIGLDDHDIWSAIKIWSHHPDRILSMLCAWLLDRKLFRVELSDKPFTQTMIASTRKKVAKKFRMEDAAEYLVPTGILTNTAYVSGRNRINILTKDGEVMDIVKLSDLPHIKTLGKIVKKYYLCFPKNVSL